MTKKQEQEKIRARKKFIRLANLLKSNLGGKNRKSKIVREVAKKTPKGGEKEGNFVKFFLAPILMKYFKNQTVEIIVEGISSKGETQFKKEFFGSKPAVDFLFKSKNDLFSTSPFPLDTVGEVKYGDLYFRSFVTGLGQIISYLKASEFEKNPKVYGYYIFFNTNIDKILTKNDKGFLEEIWEKENVFVVVI